MKNRELKTIIKMFEESSLASMKLEKDDVKIEMSKPDNQSENNNQVVTAAPAVSPTNPAGEVGEETTQINDTLNPIKAPLVGTFYEAASPDKLPFVKEGQYVNEGDTVCILEAMKVMNEISAPTSGYVKTIHVANKDMVEYDQVLMEIGQ